MKKTMEMKTRKKETTKTTGPGNRQKSDQTLQKHLVSQIMRLFLISVIIAYIAEERKSG